MIDPSVQRLNMIESQIRPSDITDQAILRAMGSVHREEFLSSERKALAYLDIDQPLVFPKQNRASQRFLWAPRTFAKLLQLAAIQPTHRVLDVGCGTGYSTAIMSKLSEEVVALETDSALAQVACDMVKAHKINNVRVLEGSLPEGCPKEAPFDIILLEGAVAQTPDKLLNQLKDGGRLVGILRKGYSSRAYRWLRSGEVVSSHPEFDIPNAFILPGFEPKRGFVF
ncbi:MAG: protein-L-isoaspartate O-methyltransferase family protein [Hyphomicrobium sp.]